MNENTHGIRIPLPDGEFYDTSYPKYDHSSRYIALDEFTYVSDDLETIKFLGEDYSRTPVER